MAEERRNGFPKIIWMLWLQGFAAAPVLVTKCVTSWRRHNPGWQIILLDENTVREYVEVDDIIGDNRDIITMQARANVIRINLLARFGGVWADATCFCCQPLDEWLGDCMVSGFFAFERPGRDRLMSNWFMASTTNCHLTQALCRAVNEYWSKNRFPYQKKRLGHKIIHLMGKLLNRQARTASLWVHPFTIRIFRLHPYFWFHYLFFRLLTKDQQARAIWNRTPKINAAIPHRLITAGLTNQASAEIKAATRGGRDPLYKLNWRCSQDSNPDSVLNCLLETDPATAQTEQDHPHLAVR
jgi:hypothetical protein